METDPTSPFPSKEFFDAVYAGAAPWDIGAPQPDLVEMVHHLPPRGTVLDLGCGTGDLAIALAQDGIPVIGIDYVPAAIAVARSRAQRLSEAERSRVEFRVGDALDLKGFEGQIDSVVDTGFYHLFDSTTRTQLVRELGEVIPSGGRYFMLGFAVSLPADNVPREVTREEISRLFNQEAKWEIRVCRAGRFLTNGFYEIPAIVVCVERL